MRSALRLYLSARLCDPVKQRPRDSGSFAPSHRDVRGALFRAPRRLQEIGLLVEDHGGGRQREIRRWRRNGLVDRLRADHEPFGSIGIRSQGSLEVGLVEYSSKRRKVEMLSRPEQIRRYVEVTFTLANREFVGRYRGNLTGILSAVAIPVLFLVTYSFVFSTLIPIRLKGADSVSDYAIFLFSGLIVWNLFSEPLSRSARLFSGSASLVKTPNFPASSLVSAACLSGFYQSLLWFLVYCVARGISQEPLHPTLLLVPVVLAIFLFFCFGICLFVGSIGVFVRDLGDFVAPVITFWMFISPVLYPSERIAAVASWLVDWNPLAPSLEMARKLSDGALPSQDLVLSGALWSVGFVLLGVLFYRRIRPVLNDVI